MGDHPADFHRARFSQLKPQLLVERSGGNVLLSETCFRKDCWMVVQSFAKQRIAKKSKIFELTAFNARDCFQCLHMYSVTCVGNRPIYFKSVFFRLDNC